MASLVASYEAGSGVKDLAKEFWIHRDTVHEHLKRAGVPIRRRGLSEDQVHRCVTLYAEGWSTARLGDRFGVTDGTVLTELRKCGVQLRKPWERV